jgi:hypothetical protein
MAAKKKTIISNRPMSREETKAFRAQKLLEETKGKKGKDLAKKIANVGKPKGQTKVGTKFEGYPPKSELVDVYKSSYTPAQRRKLDKAKATVSQMRSDRERVYTRSVAQVNKSRKKK